MAVRLVPLVLALTTLAALGCEPGPGDDEGHESSGSDAWMAMGQGETSYTALAEGDELLMVLGGQGLLMFPMPIRAQGFRLPADPSDWTDPDIPLLDIHLDIEGFDIGFGGHFSRIANYPVPFEILADGTYEFIYITIFVPDELSDPCAIDGLPGEIHAELDTADGETLEWDRTVTIAVPESLCAG
jgi:hypothetical protein